MDDDVKTLIKVLAILGVVIAAPFVVPVGCKEIDAGQRGVKTTWGKVTGEPLKEGLHFRRLIAQSIIPFNVRVQEKKIQTEAYSVDVQETRLACSISYQLDAEKVNEIYTKYGQRIEETIMYPAISSVLKNKIGQTKAEEMVEKRKEMEKTVTEELEKRLKEHHIKVTQFVIDDITFTQQFEKAVEDKVIADQEVIKQSYITKQAEERKKQDIIKAQGEAEKVRLAAGAKADEIKAIAEAEANAIELRAKALKQNPQALEMEKINKWDGALPKVVGGKDVMLNLEAMQNQR